MWSVLQGPTKPQNHFRSGPPPCSSGPSLPRGLAAPRRFVLALGNLTSLQVEVQAGWALSSLSPRPAFSAPFELIRPRPKTEFLVNQSTWGEQHLPAQSGILSSWIGPREGDQCPLPLLGSQARRIDYISSTNTLEEAGSHRDMSESLECLQVPGRDFCREGHSLPKVPLVERVATWGSMSTFRLGDFRDLGNPGRKELALGHSS